ncbi:histone deacetylase RPD3 [Coprinellus micaceus]|uniref:histone deacetylase n=1 Tax=Coprinellus micaceus TaxID=71717 RepID=A0A4Y7TDP3_COPMI|nr:histone deacetylase RPD3 [Coprinellus micaceus]
MASKSKRKVDYFHDPDVGAYTYGLGHPMKPHRIQVAHELVTAYDMLPKMQVLKAKRASAVEMTRFHTDEYVHFLHRVTPETAEELTYGGTRFLVGEDNPAFEGLSEFCSISAGGSIGAAQRIAAGSSDIAINWAGGLHHAKKREASGFCYINDIVLAILELLRIYPRVLYIDIDCHHGDGVEEAFYTTNRVMTCSFHKFGEYFPGTGTQEDRGRGKGKGYAVNIPLKDGITDESYQSVFEPVVSKILEVYKPSAVILQCGADSLSGDKLGCFNLTMYGHSHCVQFLRQQNVPLILLGGGGYTVKNVGRVWAFETACALGIEDEIDTNLPWNPYFEWFGPRTGSLDKVRITALEQLRELIPAPSVQMHDAPREPLGKHLGFTYGKDDGKSRDELDSRLAQHARYIYTLQEHTAEAPSSEDSADESSGSEADDAWHQRRASSRRRVNRPTTKKRMSLLTGEYFEVDAENGFYSHCNGLPDYGLGAPPQKHAKRRFFQGNANWEEDVESGIAARMVNGDFARQREVLGDLVERSGRVDFSRFGEEDDGDVLMR